MLYSMVVFASADQLSSVFSNTSLIGFDYCWNDETTKSEYCHEICVQINFVERHLRWLFSAFSGFEAITCSLRPPASANSTF